MPRVWAEDPDVQLMLAFQQGRRDAFDELVRRNAPKVFSVVYRFVNDTAEAEDLTQEVFMRVLRTASRYTAKAKFTTWLYRIATNVSLNALRARGKARTVSLELPGRGPDEEFERHLPDEATADSGERMARAELRDRIADALDALPETQRTAIILNKYEGLSYEDIAGILDCSTMAVKSLLSRARGNLRQRLSRYLARRPPDSGPDPDEGDES